MVDDRTIFCTGLLAVVYAQSIIFLVVFIYFKHIKGKH